MAKTDWLKSAPLSATNRQAETPLYKFLVRLMHGEDLKMEEAAQFFRELMWEKAFPAQIVGALVALTMKGETGAELAGMARTMSENSVKLSAGHRNLTDISGTGSSATKTFNVSTVASIVAAGAGLPIAKQVNRAVLSNSGSAETVEKLGINLKVKPKTVQACLNGAGIGFLYAPEYHIKLKNIGDARRHLGIRTCLNLLGVLTNPAGVSRQVVGVWHPSLLEPIAEALALLKIEKAWVVHGLDGLDEITLDGETLVIEVAKGKFRKFKISPKDFGFHRSKFDNLKVSGADESAAIINEILTSKRRDEARSLVVINAAAALIVGCIADDPMQAARLAEQSIDSGSALIKLERLQQTTNK
jgi:anthranilate phosphoribosyltransferase